MKTSLNSLLKSLVLTAFGGIALLNNASAQQIRVNIDPNTVRELVNFIGGEIEEDQDWSDEDDYDFVQPIRRPNIQVVEPDFNAPVVDPVTPPPAPVQVDAVPQPLQGVWVETTASGTTYHQLKADGTHNLGIIRNGTKERYAQQAAFRNGQLQIGGGSYRVALLRNTLTLTNAEGTRTWVRYEPNQPAANPLQAKLLGTWYETINDGGIEMLARYDFKADGTYDMLTYDRGQDGSWDTSKTVDHLAASVPAQGRTYRLEGNTLVLAEGQPHGEGPLTLKAGTDRFQVKENGKVRNWKRTP